MIYTLKYSKLREVNFKTGLTLEEYNRAESKHKKEGYICVKEIQREINDYNKDNNKRRANK
jgi:hypothetical protein